MFDIIIKNGLIVDGTGRDRFRGDLGIRADRIAGIGNLDESGMRVLDAEDCVVAPGFIDIHSHTDEAVLINPTCESKVTQGVTTEVCGNCGESAAPRGGKQNWKEHSGIVSGYPIEPEWSTLGEYFERLSRLQMTINCATLVGHAVVRSAVVGYDDRRPTSDELDRMRRLVVEAMEQGAFGLSSGLIYPPGCYADMEELIELCRVVARYGGIYATHLRSEGEHLLEAVDEALCIGRASGVGVQISHHKAIGSKSWRKVEDTLAMIDDVRSQGLDVWADQYPYVATATGLKALLPEWAHSGGMDALVARLREPEQRARLKEELRKGNTFGGIDDTGGWDSVVVSFLEQDRNRFCEGLSVSEIAGITGKHPSDVVLDLLLDEQGVVGMVHFVLNEENVKDIMRHPFSVIGSDAIACATGGPLSRGKPHPRAYGTFARVLGKYVREDRVVSLEEAVAKMTGRTAQRLSLEDRGVLAVGNYADITVFDPETIADTATFDYPHSTARGIRYVVVNGNAVVDEGCLIPVSECAPGCVVRRRRD